MAAPAGGEAPAAADSGASLEGLTIARVEVRTRNIFDPVPEGALSPIYRLGNRLHVRTRSSTVRHELLFAPGDPWSEERREESLRTLRTLDYLEPQRLEARREGDSVAVTVVTRDTWTTSPDFNLEHGGGQSFGTIGLTERNLFGLGKSVSAAYHEDPIGISRNLSFRDPAVGGSRVQLTYGAAAGVGGSTDLLSMGQPFYALDAPWAFGAAWLRSSSVLRLFQSGGEIANLDQRLHEGEAWVGRGFASDGTIVRPVLSLLIWDRDLGPSRLAPGAPPEFAGGDEKLRLRRVAVEMGMWKPNYVVREDVDRIGHAEDFDLGRSLGFKLGLSPRVLGSSVDEGYARIRGQVGAEGPLGFGYLQGAAAARMRRGPLEVLRQAEARWFVASRAGHVLVLAAHGTSGSRVARDYQVVVGGLSGLRAYPVQALAGRELVRLNAEQRWVLGRNLRDLVSIGTAVFYDAARAWGPGAAGTGWFNAAGFGLRLATPRTALGPVLRIDVAWPISPTRDGTREAVLSFGSSQAF
ncbi:MAG TPA: BamA/TamA family outer membrane protein [Candidatus Eisenbacteria bacterium]